MNEDKDLVVSNCDEVSKRRLIKQDLMEAIGQSERKLGSTRLNPIVKLVRLPEQKISAFLKPTPRKSSRERKPTVKYVIEDTPIVNKHKQNRSAMDKAIKKKTPVVKSNRPKREKAANKKKETPPSCTMSLRARKTTRYFVENSDSEEDSQDAVLIPYIRRNSSVSSSKEETPDPSSNEAPSDSVSETSENEEEKFKISEYELQVQKNIKERQKMFEMLRIKDAKKELTNIL